MRRLPRSTTDRLPQSPRLLLLVFGIFLMLIGITGSALVLVTSSHLAGTTLNAIAQRDRTLIDLFANGTLTVADLDGPMSRARAAELRDQLDALARSDEIVHVDIRDAHGDVVAAASGAEEPSSDELLGEALGGRASARLDESGSSPLLEEYLPLATDTGAVLGAVILHRDAREVLAGLGDAQRDIVLITVITAFVLAAILVAVFRAAHVRLVRQQAALAEAARRDALTGLLNHGTVVTLVAERLEERSPGAALAVALVDVDNFRLFNDTHGHEAGDEILVRVAELVRRTAGHDGAAARYGPDEFLVVRPGHDATAMADLARGLREAARDLTVRVGDSEDLPVTVSVGIAAVPAHAASVTPLLSEASMALTEARASGGDGVLIARIGEERHAWQGSYDVLQGLVLAVDAKDRYTKRHSEDVARYAVYLARRLGHHDILEPVRLAGLLHDVGKIGIPDTLLRKPSKLAEAEVRIFNQHVALGDAIVRELPDVDEVRAGIRHHHERWDGRGYLAGLVGEEIPLIARLIAVADTFSAMTTTRPYRKALPIEEALRRLRDAAGTQLQPELVDAFVEGLRTDPAAPMPNQASDVWAPLRVA